MFILLDKNREPVAEILDYLSITASIRFSSPGQIEVVISESSEITGVISELMYIYQVETSMLYLIDFIQRDMIFNDQKAVVVKGPTIDGFLDQRIVVEDKLLDGANLQASIKSLITENAINPTDTTRKIDFLVFVDSTDTHVLGANVKGLVSGISVMQAVTNLLDSKNLGYKVEYSPETKLVTFTIVAGRNLCDGFVSSLHGQSAANTVTLSVESETIEDLRSTIDLSPYKTRVYIRNFEETKVFNRGTTKVGMELREGYLSTGHGDGTFGEWEIPEPPPPPEIIMPPPLLPPEIPITPPVPDRRLLGLYMLTNKNRILACAFYPGLPVPDVWYDVTPDEVDNETFATVGRSGLILGTGDLIIQSGDRKKIYRCSMIGGWLGTRTFSKGIKIFDAFDYDIMPSLPSGPSTAEMRLTNFIASMAVDEIAGRIVATVTSPYLTWENSYNSYGHKILEGTPYDLVMRDGHFSANTTYPGYGNCWPTLSLRGGITMTSGMGWAFFNSVIHILEPAGWRDVTYVPFGGNSSHRSWHGRPVPDSDVVMFTNVEDGNIGTFFRVKDLFEGSPPEQLTTPVGFGWIGGASFSADGLTMVNHSYGGVLRALDINPGKFVDSVVRSYTQPVFAGQTFRQVVFSGIDEATGKNLWGTLRSGQAWQSNATGVPSFYVTSNADFTGLVDVTPGLKTFLKEGPWGVTTEGLLNEYPVYCWPIQG